MSLCLAQNAAASATSNLFADISKAPAVQHLARRLENGGVLTCAGVSQAAQPFFAALLRRIFPRRPIVVVTDNLKTQESFQQDLETWLALKCEVRSAKCGVGVPSSIRHPHLRRCSIPLGTCCRTKANFRMPTPSATGSKRWLPCHLTAARNPQLSAIGCHQRHRAFAKNFSTR